MRPTNKRNGNLFALADSEGQSGYGPHPVRESGHNISKIGAARCQILTF